MPSDTRAKVPVLEWLMWQMGGFGPMPGQVHHFLGVENPQDQKYRLERYMKETRRLPVWRARQAVDRRRDYVAGACSSADVAILGWAWRHERHKVDLADFPQVQAWFTRCMARPGTKRGFEVALS